MSGRGRRGGSAIPRAVLLIARGRPEGVALFGDTPDAFLASLAPWLGFLLVGGLVLAASRPTLDTLATLLSTVCALLAPPVLSELLARRWGRRALWLRYATAYGWAQWLMPAAFCVALLGATLALRAGLGEGEAAVLLTLLIAGYAFWLHWFIARHALQLRALRAAALVVAVTIGTIALVAVPRLLASGLAG